MQRGMRVIWPTRKKSLNTAQSHNKTPNSIWFKATDTRVQLQITNANAKTPWSWAKVIKICLGYLHQVTKKKLRELQRLSFPLTCCPDSEYGVCRWDWYFKQGRFQLSPGKASACSGVQTMLSGFKLIYQADDNHRPMAGVCGSLWKFYVMKALIQQIQIWVRG